MNYYIDFDHTLFNTKLLTKEMLTTITNCICKENDIEFEACFEEVKGMFNREHIYDIYKLIEYFSEKYNLNVKEVTEKINNVILNCNKFVFPDVEEFLKKLKKSGNKLYLLSYYEHELQYQTAKILGSGLVNYFNGVFPTNTKKYELDLVYENGIFIDDKPNELNGFYSKNAKQVIRIRRPNDTYSNIETNNENIKEYESLLDIKMD